MDTQEFIVNIIVAILFVLAIAGAILKYGGVL